MTVRQPAPEEATRAEAGERDAHRSAEVVRPEADTPVDETAAQESETSAPGPDAPGPAAQHETRSAVRVRFAEPEPESYSKPGRGRKSHLAQLLNEPISDGPDPDEDDDEYNPAEDEDQDEEDEDGRDTGGDSDVEADETGEDGEVEEEDKDEDDGDDVEDEQAGDDAADEEDGEEDDSDGENEGKKGTAMVDGNAHAALAATFSSLPKGILGALLAQGKLGSKPLHAAAAANDSVRVRSLVLPPSTPTPPAGGAVAATTATATTAAEEEEEEEEEKQQQQDVDGRDAFDYTALHVACEAGADAAVAALLECGADREAATKMHASRPLHYASFEGRIDACRLLLAAGAAVDARTDDLRTPLFQAAFRGHAHCVRELLRAGADPRAQARDGRCAADVAATDEIRDLILHHQEKEEQEPPKKRPRADPVA